MHSIQKLGKVKAFFFLFFHFCQWHEKNKNGPYLLTLEENLLFLPSNENETTKSGKEETGL